MCGRRSWNLALMMLASTLAESHAHDVAPLLRRTSSKGPLCPRNQYAILRKTMVIHADWVPFLCRPVTSALTAGPNHPQNVFSLIPGHMKHKTLLEFTDSRQKKHETPDRLAWPALWPSDRSFRDRCGWDCLLPAGPVVYVL